MSEITQDVMSEIDRKTGSCHLQVVDNILSSYANASMTKDLGNGSSRLDNIKSLMVNEGLATTIREIGVLQRNGDYKPGVFREMKTVEARCLADLEAMKGDITTRDTRKFISKALGETKESAPRTRKSNPVPRKAAVKIDPSVNPFAAHTQSAKFHDIFSEPHTIEEARTIRDDESLKLSDARIDALPYNYRKGDINGWTLLESKNSAGVEIFQVVHAEGAFQ